MVHEGSFRGDLFHRINVFSLQIRALQDRRDDILVLVQFFLRKYTADFGVENPAITSDAMAILKADSSPGNVHELENVMRRLLLCVE